MQDTVPNRSRTLFAITAVVVVLVAGAGCRSRQTQDIAPTLEGARSLPQGLVSLPLYRRPYNTADLEAASRYIPPLDADSIEMFEYRGGKYYQPVGISNRCYTFLAAYAQTRDTTFLTRAEKYVDKLMSLSENDGAAAWVPYEFDFAVHGDSANLLKAPWYSGMAQGELLSIVMRLYELNEDDRYATFGEKLFNSLLEIRSDSSRWVARLDSAGFYWIEEYPHNIRPGMTLNGYIAALFGVYDYYLVTNDQRARQLWDIALTTLKHYLPQYLLDSNSYYCLGHRHLATEGYHRFHISLLNYLFTMTGDRYFKIMAEAFEKNARP